jgi:hypothetical protein
VLIDRLSANIWTQDKIYLDSATTIYTNTEETNFISAPELHNLKGTTSSIQAQLNATCKIYELARFYNTRKFIKLGRLTMPVGGYHCVIRVSTSYGINNNFVGIMSSTHHLPNYSFTIYLQSSSNNYSRKYFPGTIDTGGFLFIDIGYDLFYTGYVVCDSPNVQPLGVYLQPVPSDNKNKVDIWIHIYEKSGPLLVTVTQNTGSLAIATDVADAMPLNGYVRLDQYSPALLETYSDPNN